MNKFLDFFIIIIFSFSYYAHAKEEMSDEALGTYSGQGGIELSGKFEINAFGGPKWDLGRDEETGALTGVGCSGYVVNDEKRCGARVAMKAGENEGWVVYDNLKGGIEFGESIEGGAPMRISTEEVDNNGTPVNVLKVQMSNKIRYNQLSYTYATATHDNPEAVGFKQTDILSLSIDGDVVGQGNLLIFPTD
ncbi:hypothetical protein PAHA111176_13975 [Parendozoicomonas haliclonae]|uniref:Uncharacterized protein n=2 Tax=Parendozoicomonas haliclonae TaxID=1960125 RepID=A0A1X7AHR7_9GAMM|nr:hypothetical protein EHSB41UT_01612 [Parendozoicomonas haliclonae]